MQIETYFGFFARSVFTALAASFSAQSGRNVVLERMALSTTNTLKLRWSAVDSVAVPALAEPGELPFVFAFTERDVEAITALAQGRTSLQRLMEQAVSTAVEPFNFISKTRNRLSELQFSRNVTGLTAHHLHGEVSYTMAEASMQVARGEDFGLRLLVTAQGRDLIEDRAGEQSVQRALFSINEGAYVCRPQWEPPPPPPELEQGPGLSESHLNGWLQTFLALNDGALPTRVFQQPAAMQSRLVEPEALRELAGEDGPLTVVRMLLNDSKAQELFLIVPPACRQSLMSLSKSGEVKFLGDLFRVLIGEAAQLWAHFSEAPLRWRVVAVRAIPADAVDLIEQRVAQGGLVVRQTARLEGGTLSWMLALSPHTWHALMRITAQGMRRPVADPPQRQAVFSATGWGPGATPWHTLISFCTDRDLQELVRRLTQVGLGEPHLAAVSAALEGAQRDRWLEAMPVMQRERSEAYQLGEGEAPRRQAEVAQALVALHRARHLPEGKLTHWVSLYSEMLWSHRQALIDRMLPLRHFIYGLDRSSLSRLLFDVKNELLVDVLCWAEFPVIDQVRRAISPGFALRLLEDVGAKRIRANAFTCQEAQLNLYRTCQQGLSKGRYLVRPTPRQKPARTAALDRRAGVSGGA